MLEEIPRLYKNVDRHIDLIDQTQTNLIDSTADKHMDRTISQKNKSVKEFCKMRKCKRLETEFEKSAAMSTSQ